jgi:hypothetical protein
MSEEIPVPTSVVKSVSRFLDRQEEHQEVASQLVPDDTVCSRKALIESLKEGKVPGTAYVEWSDDQGELRVNVIDFLTRKKVEAVDPTSGEGIEVLTSDIPDNTWRVLY